MRWLFAVSLAFCFGVPLAAAAETSAADTLAAVRAAAPISVDRLIVKYLFHVGPLPGT
jgi:hypothetical protein